MFLRKLRILAFVKSSSGRWGSKVTHSGAGGPWADRSHRALQGQVRLERAAGRAGDARTRNCQGVCRQALPGLCSRQL